MTTLFTPKWRPFEISVPGKWVLSGEHAVLRGALAIALPHPEFRLSLRYSPGIGPLHFETDPPEARELALSLIGQVQKITGLPITEIGPGTLRIESTIPFGAGLGSSAALCVALVRWIADATGFNPEEVRNAATRLEDRFHGRSSGMDVAVTSEARPISFQNKNGKNLVQPLNLERMPRFTFHDTGLRKKTSECIGRVERYRLEHPQRADGLDEQMSWASSLAEKGLLEFSEAKTEGEARKALGLLRESMDLGQGCFREWGLLPEIAWEIERSLKDRGAQAVRLTGAGGGGFLVALWGD